MATARTVKRAAKNDAATKKDPASATPKPPRAPKERDPRLPAVGETITKEWHGKTLKVRCTADGFDYDGSCFTSLSAVATAGAGSLR